MGWSLSGDGRKDILVVVKDAHWYVKNCLDSVFANTKDFTLHVWDNASSDKTAKYLAGLASLPNVKVHRSDTNEGFIVPNNRMFSETESEWMILLNSDTEVLPGWDELLIGVLKNNPEIKQSGFAGAILDENCEILAQGSGKSVDYISGYCFCMHRQTVEELGLFDEKNLSFAYCEDSDLSLRIRERGWEVYACHSDALVRHYGNRTTSEVIKDDERLISCARNNHSYLKTRWKTFLGLYSKGKNCYNRAPPKKGGASENQGQEV
jgi:GT2 family glycosyltransferase